MHSSEEGRDRGRGTGQSRVRVMSWVACPAPRPVSWLIWLILPSVPFLLFGARAHGQELLRCGIPAPRLLGSGEVVAFHFQATPGVPVVVDATETAPARIGLLHLRIVDGDASYDTCTGSITFVASQPDVRIEVSDCIGEDSGSFTINATMISDGNDGCSLPLPCSAAVEGARLDARGEIDSYTFAATAGRAIALELDDLDRTIGRIRARLFAPGTTQPYIDTCSGRISTNVPATGVYTVMVSACGIPATGAYRITFHDALCPTGPDLTYVGIIDARGVPVPPSIRDAQDRLVHETATGSGFSLVVEARPGTNMEAVGAETVPSGADRLALPDLQVLLSRPIGDGSSAVCDHPSGGVAAIPSLDFAPTTAVADAIHDLGCRADNGLGQARGIIDPNLACSRSAQGNAQFVDATSTVQFCFPITTALSFADGETALAVRARDIAGNMGARHEFVVRVRDLGPSFLVKDIAPGFGTSGLSSQVTAVGDIVYFAAQDDVGGVELWRSDATAAGTYPVKELRPGLDGSFPEDLTHFDGMLFFTAIDGVRGRELWRSDGTEAGTTIVRDITPGPRSTRFAGGFVARRLLYFLVDDESTGSELWRSDGTAAGTYLLADIRPGPQSSEVQWLTTFGDYDYFAADDGVHGRELWRTDGTRAGTTMVIDINPGALGAHPRELTVFQGALYFAADDGTRGREPWRSDGSAAGTQLLKDVNSFNILSLGSSDPSGFTEARGELFFSARDPATGHELWKTDGTTAGTKLVKDIRPSGRDSFPQGLIALGDELLFWADDGRVGSALWKSNGSTAGTVLVKDVSGSPLALAGGVLLFNLYGGLWRSDGTPEGTVFLHAAMEESYPPSFAVGGAHVFFRFDDGLTGSELWALPLAAIAGCPGDCNGDHVVEVDEIVTATRLMMREITTSSCAAADVNHDLSVSIGELVVTIQAALHGCNNTQAGNGSSQR